jgi:hypothetical protein
MTNHDEIYCSFLLRIWIEPVDGDLWRFSLEDTRTGKRKGFSSLKKMAEYLAELTDQNCLPEGESDSVKNGN